MKILLAEDNKSMLLVTKDMIEEQGHQVIAALNGQEALDLYQSEHPDIILMDIEMPIYDGYEVAQQIRAKKTKKWVPIIFLTAFDGDESLAKALAVGGDDYIVKPVSATKLNAKLHAMQRIVQMQRKLLRLTDDLSSEIQDRKLIEKSLNKKITQQKISANLSQLALNESRMDIILHKIIIDIAEFLGVDLCALYEFEPKRSSFTLRAAVGFNSNLLNTYQIKANDSFSSVLTLDSPLVFNEVNDDEPLNSFLQHAHSPAVCGVINAIKSSSSQWGVLCIFSSTPKRFSTEDIEFINAISNILTETVIRKTVEKELLESEERFSELASNIDEMLWISSADGKTIHYVSPAFERITGRTVEEFYSNPQIWLDCIHPDDLPLVIHTFTNLSNTGKPFSNTIRIQRADGELRTVNDHGFPVFDANGKLNRIVGTIRDITEQKKAENKLAELKLLYEYILQSAGEGIFGLDKDGKITFINPAAASMMDAKIDDLLGTHYHRAFTHSSPYGEEFDLQSSPIYKSIREGVKYSSDEELFTTKGLNNVPIDYTCTPILDRKNHILGAVVTFKDVTRRKKMEMELQVAQKLEAVGQLAAGIAHEINTPAQYTGDNIRFLNTSFEDLTTVLTKFQQLLDSASNNSVTSEQLDELKNEIETADLEYLLEEIPLALEQSQQGIDSIAKIVVAMKEFSHPGTEEKEQADINHIIENTVTVTRNEWKYVADINLELDTQLPLVPCYTQKFGQVVMNLIVNAAHAIGDVVKGTSDKGSINITTFLDGDSACITITDSGTGIPQNIIDKIFDPFFTTKGVGKGTGQGLAIARSEIIDKHEGTLNCTSEDGIGTTFTITLPLNLEDNEELAAGVTS